MPDRWLIQRAQLLDTEFRPRIADVLIAESVIKAISEPGSLPVTSSEHQINAEGGCLLPGLIDHHMHLAATAAARLSVPCGPPQVKSAKDLSAALIARAGELSADRWIRGVGYHHSVSGDLDRRWLDALPVTQPIRIQYQTGRLWILSSAAMAQLAAAAEEQGLELELPDDGRLFDQDELLRELIAPQELPIEQLSLELASVGVVALNDMTVTNDTNTWKWFADLQQQQNLFQHIRLSGSAQLSAVTELRVQRPNLTLGETKIYLRDHALPDFDTCVASLVASHDAGRPVAFHCVTEAELVFAVATVREAGVIDGDRIEHGSVIPTAMLEQLRELDLRVVTQPNFVFERGDRYLRDVPEKDHPSLYRGKSLLNEGIALAFGSDAPYGSTDPWLAMRAAVTRTTRAGQCLGPAEVLTPEEALMGYLGSLDSPHQPRQIAVGEPADCLLLHAGWQDARLELDRRQVRQVWINGQSVV